ncbi:Rapid ALkalinization Factor [Forsythia ovata]|uniref:Rapid ALkalinization Factor n=1 Tax=Forsythia ovata TaxID=205694 RepID=A0ABD1WEE1_9LAMI
MDTLKGKTLLLVVLVVCSFLSEDVQGKDINYKDLPGIPCDRDGGHQENCKPSNPANPYKRGCSPDTETERYGTKWDEDGSRRSSCLRGNKAEAESFCLQCTAVRHCLAKKDFRLPRDDGTRGSMSRELNHLVMKKTVNHRSQQIHTRGAAVQLQVVVVAESCQDIVGTFKLFKEGKVGKNFKERPKTADLRG